MPFTNLNVDWPMRDLSAQAKIASGKITGPNPYATLGEAVTLSDLGLSEVWYWAPMILTNGTVVILGIYDVVNAKIKYFDMAGVEIANGVNLSTYTTTFFVTGK